MASTPALLLPGRAAASVTGVSLSFGAFLMRAPRAGRVSFRPLARGTLRGCHICPGCASTAIQVLNRLPDPGYSNFAIGELLHRREARDAVPDLHQPAGRPTGSELIQFRLAAKGITTCAFRIDRTADDAPIRPASTPASLRSASRASRPWAKAGIWFRVAHDIHPSEWPGKQGEFASDSTCLCGRKERACDCG